MATPQARLLWYKHYHLDFLDGVSNLSLEETGAYIILLDLIYARGGGIKDDERFISGNLRCDIRVWKRIRSRLLSLKKLYAQEGLLRNFRADLETTSAEHRMRSSAEAGRTSAAKRWGSQNKNNGLDVTGVTTDPMQEQNQKQNQNKKTPVRTANGCDEATPLAAASEAGFSEQAGPRIIYASDLASDDQLVVFSDADLRKLQDTYPSFPNVRGRVRQALRMFTDGTPAQRRRAAFTWLDREYQRSVERMRLQKIKATEKQAKMQAKEVEAKKSAGWAKGSSII